MNKFESFWICCNQNVFHFSQMDFTKKIDRFWKFAQCSYENQLCRNNHQNLHNYQFRNRLLTITADNAANNQTIREKMKNELQKIDIEWNHLANTIFCMAHVIQLIVKALLSDLKTKKSIISSKNDLINVFKTLKQDLEFLNFANIIFKIVVDLCYLFWYYYWFFCDKCGNSSFSSNFFFNDWKIWKILSIKFWI